MPNPPSDVKVEKVLSPPGDPWGGGLDKDGKPKSKMRTYEEVLFEGDGRTRKAYVPEDIALADGETVKGWFNSEKGTWTIADPNPPQNGAGRASFTTTSTGRRDDATGQSIERQTAAKCAAEMAAAVGGLGPVVLANFEELFEAAHRKITGVSEET